MASSLILFLYDQLVLLKGGIQLGTKQNSNAKTFTVTHDEKQITTVKLMNKQDELYLYLIDSWNVFIMNTLLREMHDSRR